MWPLAGLAMGGGAAAGGAAAGGGFMSGMGASLIGAGGGVLSGLIGKSGQAGANKMNRAIAREQMAFQERMSNTAYQRAAKDLDAARLNRILALGSPATTPPGAKTEYKNEDALLAEGINKGVSSAFAGAQLKQNIKESNARIGVQNATATRLGVQTQLDQKRAGLVGEQTVTEKLRQVGITTDNQRKELDRQIKSMEIPGVQSAEQFYRWLITQPAANRDYHMQKVYGASKLGMVQKLWQSIDTPTIYGTPSTPYEPLTGQSIHIEETK